MYRHILIATDGSELAEKAVHHGIELGRAIGARVTALTVALPYHVRIGIRGTPDADVETAAAGDKRVHEHAEQILREVADRAKAAGVACETVALVHEHPYQAIIDTATARGCDLIVMASHGRRGLSALVLGSETVKVLTHCKIPVLVHR
jgi:nucleotide-binding universal stress UspA family protein